MIDCVNGCVQWQCHLPGCVDSTCRGCVPRAADAGVLCAFCFQRLVGNVVDIPGIHAHLLGMASAGVSSGKSQESRGRSVPGSRVLYRPALAAAEEIASLLGSWADEIVRLHPGSIRPPSSLGWRFSEPSRAIDDETGEAYIPSANRLGASQSAVESLVRWMLPHMSWIRDQEWVGDMASELSREVSTAKARWPIEERSHHVPMPCPYCAQRALVYVPPSEYQSSAMVSCENNECGHMWLEDAWTRTVEIALARPDLVEGVVRDACS